MLDLYDNSEYSCSRVTYKSSVLYFYWCVNVLYSTTILWGIYLKQNMKIKLVGVDTKKAPIQFIILNRCYIFFYKVRYYKSNANRIKAIAFSLFSADTTTP